MADYQNIRTGRHCTFVMHAHLVFVRHYWRANQLWSGPYFAGSVGGAPLSIVRQYIEEQNRPL
ncbi:transposase [Streptomyces sp. NPDC127069]|uniref:transposase n=1 Tax=Streptomyces sp. NPDC127069 TaxID=3347128 RepID=UPI003663A7A1